MKRHEAWPRLLIDYIEARRDMPFSWDARKGQCCASLAIGAIEAITGVRVWDVTWSDQDEALEAIKAAGGLVSAISSVLGPPSQNCWIGQRGDVGLAYIGERQTMVICTGQTWVGPGETRIEHLPLDAVNYVWKVG